MLNLHVENSSIVDGCGQHFLLEATYAFSKRVRFTKLFDSYEDAQAFIDHNGTTICQETYKSEEYWYEVKHPDTCHAGTNIGPNSKEAIELAAYKFKYGKEEDHHATLNRARKAKVSYIWSGHMKRNAYLLENFQFALLSGAFKAESIEQEQESGFKITWL
jgi:hypothetical protein